MDTKSVQERFAPSNACFGCGPSNAKGLRIRSFKEGDELVCDWRAEPHHEAFPGAVSGGIVGTLLDCHSNWATAIHLMERAGANAPPSTVTAGFAVTFKKPTPSHKPLRLRARVVESTDTKATVEATIEADGEVTATCRGTFVSVLPGHPAYHRW